MPSKSIVVRRGLPFILSLAVACGGGGDDGGPPGRAFILGDGGFRTPESILYDAREDIYLVANINGAPNAQDDNGYISKVSPEGEVLDLKWIDGGETDVDLDAPKGMAVHGDNLYVADISRVRIFDRKTGLPRGEVDVTGSVFLNDVACGPDGVVYVTDTNQSNIYRIEEDRTFEMIRTNVRIEGPNGVVVGKEFAFVVDWKGNKVYRLDSDWQLVDVDEVPGSGLDGIVLLPDGSIVVSSWEASAVYRVSPSGEVTLLFEGIPAPADIGYDSKRERILIPHFKGNEIEARQLIYEAK